MTADVTARVKELIEEAIGIGGETLVGEVLQGIANKNVTEAVAVLHSSKWWVQTIKMAMDNPKTVNTLLLNKLLDKAHPTPQSIRVGGDEGFKLIIEHVGKE